MYDQYYLSESNTSERLALSSESANNASKKDTDPEGSYFSPNNN